MNTPVESLPQEGPGWKTDLAAIVWYTTLALVVMLPALLAGEACFVGDPRSDLYKHVWGHWWVGRTWNQHGAWPLACDLLRYPQGGTLFVIDPFNCLVCWVGEHGFSRTQVFNGLVTSQLVLAAWGAFRLAWWVTQGRSAALVAGTIFGFNSWFLSYAVASGVSEMLAIGWLPLQIVLLLRLLARPTLRNTLLLAAAAVIAALSSWYLLLFGGLLGGILFATGLFASRLPPWLPRPGMQAARKLGFASLLVLLGLGRMIVLMQSSFAPATTLEPPLVERTVMTSSTEGQKDFFVLSDFVLPGKDRLHVTTTIDLLMQTPYLGWLALGLAALGTGRTMRVWGWITLIFFVLSLGPSPALTDHVRPSLPCNLLYLLSFRVLRLALISSPFRIHLMTVLGVSLLAGAGAVRVGEGALAALGHGPGMPSRTLVHGALALVFSMLVFGEVSLLSPAPLPLATAPDLPTAYTSRAAGTRPDTPPRRGRLDLPPLEADTTLTPGVYYLEQTAHGEGMPYSTGGVYAPQLADNAFFVACWRQAVGLAPEAYDDPRLGHGLEALAGLGYRSVVVHRNVLKPPQVRTLCQCLNYWLGPPVHSDAQAIRYSLEPTVNQR